MAVGSGRRDVELVIKARDEASKGLNAVADTLDKLEKVEQRVAASTDKTGTSLDRLKVTADSLAQATAGLDAFNRIAVASDKADTSITRLGSTLNEIADDQRRVADTTLDLATKSQQLDAVVAELSGGLATTKARFEALQATEAEYAAGLKRTEGLLKERVSEENKLRQQYVDSAAALDKTVIKQRELAATIAASDAPTKAQISNFERVNTRLDEQRKALEQTSERYDTARRFVREYGEQTDVLRGNLSKTSAELAETRTALDGISNRLKDSKGEAAAAAASLTSLGTAAQQLGARFAQTETNLQRAREEVDRIGDVSKESAAGIDRIGASIRESLLRTLEQARSKLAEYRVAAEQAQEKVERLSQSGFTGPKLDKAVAEARELTSAYEELQNVLRQGTAVVLRAGNDITRLGEAQQVLTTGFNRVGKSAKDFAAETALASRRVEEMREAQARFGGAAARAAAEQQGLNVAIRGTSDATRQAAQGSNLLAAAIRSTYGESRTSLSLFQRLRGEVLSLAAAYGGLFGAINGLTSVIDTYRQIEAAQSRLGVVFEQDNGKIAASMDLVRDRANRLGIDFGLLAQNYSQLAVATKGTNLEGQKTVDIFDAVIKAGRVYKLSNEQIEGTILALSQMVSKGVVSMEELRRQLGDRLPGAFQIAAKSMGLTTAELNELVASGNLATTEFLPAFAKGLSAAVDPQVETSLGTLTSQMGFFGNAVKQAQLIIAEEFVPALTEALKTLTAFIKSDDGRQFFTNLGKAAATVIQAVAQFPKYFDEAVQAFLIWRATKIVAYFIELGGAARAAGLAVQGFTQAQIAADAASLSGAKALSLFSGGLAATATNIANAARGLAAFAAIAAVPIGIIVDAKLVYDAVVGINELIAVRKQLAEAETDQLGSQLKSLFMANQLLAANRGLNVEIKTQAELLKTSNLGFEDYIKQLQDGIDRQRALGIVQRATGESTVESAKRLKELKEAMEAATKAADKLGGSTKVSLDQIRVGGEEAVKAVAKLAQGLEKPNAENVRRVAEAIQQIGPYGIEAARVVEDGLRRTLDGLSLVQLRNIQVESEKAFKGMENSARAAEAFGVALLNTALEKLGVDTIAVGDTFTATGEEIVAGFKLVANSAYATSQQITDAFKGAVGKAGTREELLALQQDLTETFKAGKVQVDAYNVALDETTAKIREISVELDPLAAAFERLGITSQKALDAAAASAKDAFENIVNGARNGLASQADVKRAWEAQAEAQLAAAKDVEPWRKAMVESALQAQGAIYGTEESLKKLGLAGEDAGAKTAAGMDRGRASVDGLRESLEAATQSAADLAYQNNVAGQSASGLGSALGNAAASTNSFSSAISAAGQGVIAATSEIQDLEKASDEYAKASVARAAEISNSGGYGSQYLAGVTRQLTVEQQRLESATAAVNAQYNDASSEQLLKRLTQNNDSVRSTIATLEQQKREYADLSEEIRGPYIQAIDRAIAKVKEQEEAAKAALKARQEANAAAFGGDANVTTTTNTNTNTTNTTATLPGNQTIRVEIALLLPDQSAITNTFDINALLTPANIARIRPAAFDALSRGLDPWLLKLRQLAQ